MRPVILSLVLTTSVLSFACLGDDAPAPTIPASSPAASPETGLLPATSTYGQATFFAADPGDSAGAVAVGDFNGDGTADLVLAAARADGPENSRPDAGEAYLFLGPFQPGEERDAAAGGYDAIIYGADADDRLGHAIAAGDINGDGVDDIVLAAPFADGPNNGREDAGEVHAIFGSPALGAQLATIDMAKDQQDAIVWGADPEDLAGFALAAADLGGDTADDLIIGALWADGPENARPNVGEVYVILHIEPGQGLDLAQPPPGMTTVYGAETEDRLGEAVGAGDVDGDGRDDLIVAATFADGPDNSRQDAGEVYVIIAPPPQAVDIASGGQDISILGVDAGDQIGHSLASADVTGDGAADLLLGALSSEGLNNARDLAGEGYLVAGGPSLAPVIDVAADGAATTIYGSDATDRLGRSAAAGDVNGDGKAEMLLGAPGADGRDESKENAGEVYLFYGQASYEPADMTANEARLTLAGLASKDTLAHDSFGTPPLLASDIDGDTLAEIIVTAPWGDGPDNRRRDAGEAYILFVQVE